MERDVGVGAFIAIVDFAHIEGLGIDVDADGALIEFRKIQNLMHGFERIDVRGMSGIHFVNIGRSEMTCAVRCIAIIDVEILDFEAADGR